MSILLKEEIRNGYKDGLIKIVPYNEQQLQPNSYDVTLSPILVVYTEETLDMKKNNATRTIEIPEVGYILQPGVLYLGSTNEKIGSDYFVPMYETRSSVARLGIFTHMAGFGDCGFKSNWTLELSVVHPIRIYPNVRIGQICFHNVNQHYNLAANLYRGKYHDQKEPQASKSYLDF